MTKILTKNFFFKTVAVLAAVLFGGIFLRVLAVDGSGTNIVSPTSTTVGSTGGIYTFTYSSAEAMNSGAVSIAVPSGWSAPQGVSGVAGYTTISSTGTVGSVLDTADSAIDWSAGTACGGGAPTVDTAIKQEGAGSIRCITANQGSGDVFYKNITAQNWSGYTKVGLWIRISKDVNTNNFRFSYDDSLNLASPLESVVLPSALTANTWTYVVFNFGATTRTSIQSFGFTITNATAVDNATIYTDFILIGPGTPTFSGTEPWTINSNLLEIANGNTVTVTYGSGGGASGVIASSIAGINTFTTQSRNTVSGSLTNIGTSPTITVNNSVPTTTSISPTSKTVGDAEFTMTVNGTNFISSSVVKFAGTNKATTYINASQLTAVIPASDLTTAGTFDITVFNPTPGGGTSNAQTFTVTATTDIIAPTITSFSIPSTSTSLTITITSFIATDNVGVSKYLLNESASTPLVSDTGWASTAPTTYIFSSEGSKTLYAWAKDASGNISTSLSAGITITLPITTVISPAQIQDSISGGIIVPNATLTSSSNVTFTQQVQIDFSTGSTITVPINTVLNAGTNIDFGQLSGTSVVSTSDLSAISATYTVLGAVEFGSGCSSLTASLPVTIKIPVNVSYNGQTMTIFKKDSCGINWEQLTTCVASAGFCQFTTTNFTRFALVAIAAEIISPQISTPGSVVAPTHVKFSGRAYPNGKIRVYRRSVIESMYRNDYLPNFDINIDNVGNFDKTFTGLLQSNYLFALEGIDKNGQSGGITSFTANLLSGDNLVVSEIFMPPTVIIPNKSITKGNEIKITGYAYPNSNIELKIDNILRINSTANSSGYYEAIINTSRFSPKTHFLMVRQIDKDGIASNFSASKNFTVSALSYPQADFNGDNIIDIRDWSIFLFRWKANPTLRAFNDLNLDGKVDILDLSIFLKAIRGL